MEEKTAADTPDTSPEVVVDSEAKPGADKVLVFICLALWLGALIVLFVRAPGMRINWQLGNLKQALDTASEDDAEGAIAALVELAESTPVVDQIREELEEGAQFDPYRQDKILFRIALVQVAQRIPGEEAFEAIRVATQDPDPRVRRFSYVALRGRVAAGLCERREAAVAIMDGANHEMDLVGRVVAIQQVADLDALPEKLETRLLGAWPFIAGLRDARLGGEETPSFVLRKASLDGFKALVGDDAEFDYDPSAELEARDAQLEALEAWFDAHGGTRPEGAPNHADWKASLTQTNTDPQPSVEDEQGQ